MKLFLAFRMRNGPIGTISFSTKMYLEAPAEPHTAYIRVNGFCGAEESKVAMSKCVGHYPSCGDSAAKATSVFESAISAYFLLTWQ